MQSPSLTSIDIAVLQINVTEGDSAEELLAGLSGELGERRAVYELTAVIAHIRDKDEPAGDAATVDGHLVAHIKVRTVQFWFPDCIYVSIGLMRACIALSHM